MAEQETSHDEEERTFSTIEALDAITKLHRSLHETVDEDALKNGNGTFTASGEQLVELHDAVAMAHIALRHDVMEQLLGGVVMAVMSAPSESALDVSLAEHDGPLQ